MGTGVFSMLLWESVAKLFLDPTTPVCSNRKHPTYPKLVIVSLNFLGRRLGFEWEIVINFTVHFRSDARRAAVSGLLTYFELNPKDFDLGLEME